MKNDNRKRTDNTNKDANPDPITNAPGAHPVGTGIGAAGGAAAGAAIGSVGGPIGAGVGIAAGAIAGGLAGKGVAEHFDPTVEDAYWREHYTTEPYYTSGYTFEDYEPVYHYGYDAYTRYGSTGKRFEDIETDLRNDYERNRGKSRLNWDQAKGAVRAAWDRLFHRSSSAQDYGYAGNSSTEQDYHRLIDYEVVDRNDTKIGTVNHLWTDSTGQPAFLGIKTGWLFGKTHVVPVHAAEVNHATNLIRLPFTEDQIKAAPSYDPDEELDANTEAEIYRYFDVEAPTTTAGFTSSANATGTQSEFPTRAQKDVPMKDTEEGAHMIETQEETRIPLREEQITVGKREVASGGVRLRKIVRTETVNQPVELRREEIVIERVPASGATTEEVAFEERDIFVPLRREEPVVSRENRVREEVRVGKRIQTDRQTVTEQVRKEDVEVEDSTEANQTQKSSTKNK